jgi:hypothetical protein
MTHSLQSEPRLSSQATVTYAASGLRYPLQRITSQGFRVSVQLQLVAAPRCTSPKTGQIQQQAQPLPCHVLSHHLYI